MHMKITGLFLASAALLAVQAITVLAADEPNQRNLQVVGLMVVAPDGGKDNRSYCWKPGVTVSVLYAPMQGKIVSFNENQSKLDSFTDDKGTDLMAAPPSTDPFNKPGISGMLPASQDGVTSMVFDLKASGQPAKGATAFTITGKASVQVAASTKQFTVENVEIKTNAAFSLGDLPVVISEAGTNRNAWASKDYPYAVTFSSLRDMDSISTLEFFDANGKKVAAEKRGWGGGPLGYMIQYDLKQNIDRAKIVATCWEDLKTIEVPISVKATVGL
jgi:hypothetical protein